MIRLSRGTFTISGAARTALLRLSTSTPSGPSWQSVVYFSPQSGQVAMTNGRTAVLWRSAAGPPQRMIAPFKIARSALAIKCRDDVAVCRKGGGFSTSEVSVDDAIDMHRIVDQVLLAVGEPWGGAVGRSHARMTPANLADAAVLAALVDRSAAAEVAVSFPACLGDPALWRVAGGAAVAYAVSHTRT